MVKNFGTQFCFLAAGAIKKAVINNEGIFPFFIRQIPYVIVHNVCRKKKSETEPVCFCRIKKAIENVLGKLFHKRVGTLLHIHTSSNKNVAEFITQ